MTIPVFKHGDDPIDAINHVMSFLYAVVTSRYPTTNNQLRNSSNSKAQATIKLMESKRTTQYWGDNIPYVARYYKNFSPGGKLEYNWGNRGLLRVTTAKGKDTCPNNALNQEGNEMTYGLKKNYCWSIAHALSNDTLTAELERYKEQVKVLNEGQNVALIFSLLKNDFKKEESRNIDREIALEKRIKQFQNPFYLKKAQQLEPKLYVGDIIVKTNPIVIPDSEETLMLAEESPHSTYIKHTQEEATVLRDLVEHVQLKYPLDQSLESACRRVKPSTSASRSQPSGNTKKDKIHQTPSSTQMNKVKAHLRKVKSSFKNKDCVVQPKGTAHVQHSKCNANSELKCVKCNGCMLSDNHDLCVLDFINNGNTRKESKSVNKSSKRKVWKPTGKVSTTTTEVPLRKSTALDNETSKPVVTLVYSRKPRKSKTNVHVSKSTVLKSVSANKKEPNKSWGSKVSDVPSSSLDECRSSKLFFVKFENDHVAKILGYGDYQIGNVTISKVYYVEGFRHNLFSLGQFCNSNLEVALRLHTCVIRNLEGVYLLTGSRGNNLYTLSFGDMMASFPISRHGLVRGLPKLKFEKDHLCSACAMGKSKKKPHKPKFKDTNQEKLYLLHMDLCGPIRVASVNGKKYILVIVDDYSRFTWVKFLSGKTTALESLRLSRAQILWGMYHNKKVDYVYLLWEDLVFQVENKNSKKNNDMYYPRFTKVIIDYFMAKDQAIPRKNKMFWYHARDDFMFTTYMTYHAYATGEKTPKPKTTKKKVDSEASPKTKTTQATKGKRIKSSAKGDKAAKKKQPAETSMDKGLIMLSDVALTEAEQLRLVIERSRTQTHSSHASGSVIPFDHFINNDLAYLSGGVFSRTYETFVIKTKAADYGHIKWIEDLVPNTIWSEVPNHCSHKASNCECARLQKHLDWITVRRDDNKLYTFKEGDFKRLRLQDIKDMLILLVQGKLTNLNVEDCLAFGVSLRMFTRSIVIQGELKIFS
ncbi:retrovirus-related pol polyprotein from transposon TNT 1-94 [Tanacetum coccineum]